MTFKGRFTAIWQGVSSIFHFEVIVEFVVKMFRFRPNIGRQNGRIDQDPTDDITRN